MPLSHFRAETIASHQTYTQMTPMRTYMAQYIRWHSTMQLENDTADVDDAMICPLHPQRSAWHSERLVLAPGHRDAVAARQGRDVRPCPRQQPGPLGRAPGPSEGGDRVRCDRDDSARQSEAYNQHQRRAGASVTFLQT